MNKKVVYKSGPIVLTELETARGKRISLDMGGDAVLIIPRTQKGTYLLTSQIRPGKTAKVIEFPSGGIKPGEIPEDSAKREALEELGAEGTLTFMTKTEPLSGLVTFNLYIYTLDITNVSEEARRLDPHEEVSVIELTKKELCAKITSTETIDGYILLGLGALMINTI